MPVEVIMPKVDMDMASGRIAVWHVEAGARVEKSEALFDIETDKAAMEVESPASGTLHHVIAEAGSEVAIGQPVAWIYADGEAVGPRPDGTAGGTNDDHGPQASASDDGMSGKARPPAPSSPEEPAKRTPEPAPSGVGSALPAALSHAVPPRGTLPRATPKARRLARDNGLEIAAIDGNGPRGRIQAGDVARHLEALSRPETASAAPLHWSPEAGPLSVLRSGKGDKTPIVLLHGFASDGASWAPLLASLPTGHPVYRIELPSHGRSPRRRIASFAELVRDMRQAFDGLGLQQAHLVGHSLGGAVAAALADTRARRIASLTLFNPAGLGPEINGPALAGIARATRAESLAPWLKLLPADEETITSNYVRSVMLARADPALRAAQADLAGHLFPDGVQAFSIAAALDRIELPTRIIWGKRDRIIPWSHALRAPGRISLNLFENAGHLPHIELAGQIGILFADMK
ncbi:acetoin dehydrogenase dihydrolipoyllysine-residue acetyltransferase subunit [Stappia sp. MMSF_3263]|uniref:acetoin dehydrogenase dihydrolipoyllysine-residue acetyltransferase subunit n=1 Tax=Stappia sp. MMSF_3263 TaxID=3046693 RepID=UPI00273E1A58|nr:acetoin dehydrogenase dihydrolipoyllysine-residue acetyltransferase subunit [Stappia sp. MMSF_3263]